MYLLNLKTFALLAFCFSLTRYKNYNLTGNRERAIACQDAREPVRWFTHYS